MRIAILEPCFYPPKPYFDLIRYADVAVLHTDLQYTRRRLMNRFFARDDVWITMPVRRNKHPRPVADTLVCPFESWHADMCCKLRAMYGGRIESNPVFRDLQRLQEHGTNLGFLAWKTTNSVLKYFNISTPLFNSAELASRTKGKHGQDKIIAICKALGCDVYIEPTNRRRYFDELAFHRQGLRMVSFEPKGEDKYSVIDHAFTWDLDDDF